MTRKLSTFFALILVLMTASIEAHAMGDLTLTPWRIVFGPRGRSATIELLNTSDRANTYRIGWMMQKATAEGRYDQIPYDREKDKDPHTVPNMVVYSPRQVTIEPHSSQVVRFSLRRPADLPPGEYRAHVTFIRMADAGQPDADEDTKTVQLQLNVNLGFSVPVIVRQGEDKDLKISLSNPQLKPGKTGQAFIIQINRDAGKFSSYGKMEAYWKPSKGEEKKIGEMNNVALYPELKSRSVLIPVTAKDDLSGGEVRIVYLGQNESEGTIWAEKIFPIAKK